MPTIDDAMAIVLAALSLLGLGIFGPGIASGLVQGGPQLGAGAAVGTGIAVGGTGLAAAGVAGLGGRAGGAALAGGSTAVRSGAAATGAIGAAYSLGSLGQSGPGAVAPGMGGVARAAGTLAVSPLRRAVGRASEGVTTSVTDGAQGAFGATGGALGSGPSSAEATANPSHDTQPAWAKRMKRGPSLSHGAMLAAHAIRSGDGHGGGASISLTESDRS